MKGAVELRAGRQGGRGEGIWQMHAVAVAVGGEAGVFTSAPRGAAWKRCAQSVRAIPGEIKLLWRGMLRVVPLLVLTRRPASGGRLGPRASRRSRCSTGPPQWGAPCGTRWRDDSPPSPSDEWVGAARHARLSWTLLMGAPGRGGVFKGLGIVGDPGGAPQRLARGLRCAKRGLARLRGRCDDWRRSPRAIDPWI